MLIVFLFLRQINILKKELFKTFYSEVFGLTIRFDKVNTCKANNKKRLNEVYKIFAIYTLLASFDQTGVH